MAPSAASSSGGELQPAHGGYNASLGSLEPGEVLSWQLSQPGVSASASPPPGVPRALPPPSPYEYTSCQMEHCHTAQTITMGCACLGCALLLPLLLRRIPHQPITEMSGMMLMGGLMAFLWTSIMLRFSGHDSGHGVGDSSFELDTWDNIGLELARVSQSALVHDMIYYVLLPPIIFEAGFAMNSQAFFANFVPITLYAVVGTLVAIFSLGGFIYLMVKAGAMQTDFSFNEVMLFASLISSTDPIATLATLRQLSVAPPLYDLVLGESALNDVISIACFNAFRELCREEVETQQARVSMEQAWETSPFDSATWSAEHHVNSSANTSVHGASPQQNGSSSLSSHESADGQSFESLFFSHHHHTSHTSSTALSQRLWERVQVLMASWGDSAIHMEPLPHQLSTAATPGHWSSPGEHIGKLFLKLVVLLPSSLLVGVAIGLLSAFITKQCALRSWGRPHVELALLLLCGLLSYSVPDQLDMSPILALFFCAMTQRHYTYHNLSSTAQRGATIFFRTVASLAEALLSILLGVAVVDYIYKPRSWDMLFIGVAILGMLLARLLNIVPLTWLANLCRRPGNKITGNMQVVMWWAGMRGGVSFAMAMSLVDVRREDHPWEKAAGSEDQEAMALMSHQHANRICTATLVTIVFTNFVFAPVTAPLISRLKLNSKPSAPAAAAKTSASEASRVEAPARSKKDKAIPAPLTEKNLDEEKQDGSDIKKVQSWGSLSWVSFKREAEKRYFYTIFGGAEPSSGSDLVAEDHGH